ncbi:DUF2726 domain-containing protein [Calycomorphotria hydatis]|uniref:DUF2726 domain-containing protein n=1 Tax=Calycomorphotria hydatis TaxID=2528027 RepID=A0A517TBR0_9PLAN|nr:DUF2726 domain-containing protein [Calycomorphotria hydatis]QDT65803.1 hypothetical protein V22_30650 [Calycomorphotria hydatis]
MLDNYMGILYLAGGVFVLLFFASAVLAMLLQSVVLGKPKKNAVTESRFPYGKRDALLSAAELSFYHVLLQAIDANTTVCCKVNLNDLFFVREPQKNQGARNRIDRKHVDFVLCDAKTMSPLCGIELDDKSHRRGDRVKRDKFVNGIFDFAGVPLLRVPASLSYSLKTLKSELHNHLVH